MRDGRIVYGWVSHITRTRSLMTRIFCSIPGTCSMSAVVLRVTLTWLKPASRTTKLIFDKNSRNTVFLFIVYANNWLYPFQKHWCPSIWQVFNSCKSYLLYQSDKEMYLVYKHHFCFNLPVGVLIPDTRWNCNLVWDWRLRCVTKCFSTEGANVRAKNCASVSYVGDSDWVILDHFSIYHTLKVIGWWADDHAVGL